MFLKDALSNHLDYQNIFIFFHQYLWFKENHPVLSSTPNNFAGRKEPTNFYKTIAPMLEELPNNVFMFAGDTGAFSHRPSYFYHQQGNITMVGSGMGGEVNDNVVVVRVSEEKKVSFSLITINGNDIDKLGKLENFSPPQQSKK